MKSELVGIDMRDDAQLAFTADVVLKYKSEFMSLDFNLVNGSFMAGDGNTYYSLIREFRPSTIIEVGAGNSTVLANAAIDRNVSEGHGCKLIAIDPFPPASLTGLAHLHELKACNLQDVEMDYFTSLDAGDILFIDSSHVLSSGSDVWLEYCEIIPRLKPGVLVHLHDISLPKPYPSVYAESQLHYNEQYLLQALLTHNERLEVVWAGTYLFDKYPEGMQAAFSPEFEMMREQYPLAEPTSLWLRVRL